MTTWSHGDDLIVGVSYNRYGVHVTPELAATSSGRELASIGFGQDVAVAAELDASASVPTLTGARFVDASHGPMSHIGCTDAPT